jgi:hypothetical protein
MILQGSMNVYISYSGADEKWADQLRTALGDHDIDVWNPASQIAPGQNWGLKYGNALKNADAVVVLLSPASVKSDWVRHEIEFALSSPQFRDRLIPVIVRPTDDIPWILRKQQIIRATKDTDETARRIASVLRKSPAPAGK